jgi:hypothetical protein
MICSAEKTYSVNDDKSWDSIYMIIDNHRWVVKEIEINN